MLITDEAKEAARYLVDAWDSGRVEILSSYIDVTAQQDTSYRLVPIMGAVRGTFSCPSLGALCELDEHELIAFSEGITRGGGKKWDIRLKSELRKAVQNDFELPSATSKAFGELPHIFISYSREDKAFRNTIEPILGEAYDDVWSDRQLHGGDEWWEKILGQIEQCDIFLYLLSPSSIKSKFCRAEYAEAVRLKKQILPVKITPKTPIPAYVAKFQWIDMSDGIDSDTVTQLFGATIRCTVRILSTVPEPLWKRKTTHPDRSVRIQVPADKDPVECEWELNTGVLVMPDDVITVRANGEITIDDGTTRNNPRGLYLMYENYPEPVPCFSQNAYPTVGCPGPVPSQESWGMIGSLFGWIGGDRYRSEGFYVGERTQIQVEKEGFLFLAVNDDRETYGDNRGAFDVTIELLK